MFSFTGRAQDIAGMKAYKLSFKVDAPVVAVAVGTNILGSVLWGDISITKTRKLSFSGLTKFEHDWVSSAHPKASTLSGHTRDAAVIAPILIYIFPEARKQFFEVSLIIAETYAISAGLTTSFKAGFRRPRPYIFESETDLAIKLSKHDQTSFVSGHTSGTATGSFLFAQLYSDLHPHSRARPFIWAAAATLPAVTGYLRVRGGRHYVSDVVGGYLVGAACGMLIPRLHYTMKKQQAFKLSPTENGFYAVLTF